MLPTLRYGSINTFVAQLQNFLNQLPTLLDSLAVDGVYGPLTTYRVKEFQRDNDLLTDGVTGPMTWGEVNDLMAGLFKDDRTMGPRLRVVGTADVEARLGFNVAMKLAAGADPADPQGRAFRRGNERVLRYFQAALRPVQFQTVQDNIIHLTTAGQVAPMPHWCGIFALWAVKTAQIPVGLWDLANGGIGSVKGFRITRAPRVGDIGFINNGFEHHVILSEDPFVDGVTMKIRTIEGNGDPNSNFNFKIRAKSEVHTFYTCY